MRYSHSVAWIFPLLAFATPIEVVEIHRNYYKLSSHADFLKADHESVKIQAHSLRKRGIHMTLHDAEPFKVITDNNAKVHTLPIYGHTGPSTSSKFASLLTNATVPVSGLRDQIFVVPITVGGQQFHTIIDTGSADTWLAGPSFSCRPPANAPANMRDCGFGPSFNPVKSTTYKPSTAEFWIQYGAESLNGIRATEKVSLGGLTSQDQTIAIINSGFWRGDGKSSGLLGLALPGASASLGLPGTPMTPLFSSLVRAGKTAPIFSLALGRGKETGEMALGGPANAKTDGKWAKSPMQYITFEKNPAEPVAGKGDAKIRPSEDFRMYRFTVSGFNVQGASLGSRRAQLAVDSGTAHSILPTDVSNAINKLWRPAARKDRALGWVVPCNAKFPGGFGIKVGGVELTVDAADMVIPGEKEGAPCMSAVQEMSWPGGGLLGSSFLKGVVAVFDIGGAELRFAKRLR
jgi:hypothetical protein